MQMQCVDEPEAAPGEDDELFEDPQEDIYETVECPELHACHL